MKKNKIKLLAAALTLAALPVFLTSCKGYRSQKNVNSAAEWGVGTIVSKDISGDIQLPTAYGGNTEVKLSWSSDKPNVISDSGVFNRPEQDEQVKLTCKAEHNKKTASRDVTVTAKAEQQAQTPQSLNTPLNAPNDGKNGRVNVPQSLNTPNDSITGQTPDNILNDNANILNDLTGNNTVDGEDLNGAPIRRMPYRGGRRRYNRRRADGSFDGNNGNNADNNAGYNGNYDNNDDSNVSDFMPF
jgi:hypothetical protein